MALVLPIAKNLERNFFTRNSHEVIEPDGKEFNHAFAFSFKENGKRLNFTDSSKKFWNLHVAQIERNYFICM